MEKAVRLIDDTCNINDPMTFYKRVDELYDDFDEVSLELTDLNSFLGGVQKEKFNKACEILSIYEASKNFISDAEIIEYANQIKNIINIQKPYSFINKLDGTTKKLSDTIVELLEKDAERIRPEVYSDKSLVMESLVMERPYADRLKKKFDEKFDELIEKIERTHDVAALNGIPSESNALCQNCLNEINHEEEFYQRSFEHEKPKADDGKPVDIIEKVNVVKTVPIGIRTLTKNKTYTIKTVEDVDAFVEEIRKELKAKLAKDIVIKLN